MYVTRKDIRLFRIVNILACMVSVGVLIFFSKEIGGPLLALSLFFLFTPFKEGDELKS